MEVTKCFSSLTSCFRQNVESFLTSGWDLCGKIAGAIMSPLASLQSLFGSLCPCCLKGKATEVINSQDLADNASRLLSEEGVVPAEPPVQVARAYEGASAAHTVGLEVLGSASTAAPTDLEEITSFVSIALKGEAKRAGTVGWLTAAQRAHDKNDAFQEKLKKATPEELPSLNGMTELIAAQMQKLDVLKDNAGCKREYLNMIARRNAAAQV